MSSSYESSGGWCWISGKDAGGIAQRLLLFYIPVWTAVSFNCFVYYKVIKRIRLVSRSQQPGDENSGDLSKILAMINRLKLYPLILVICWIFPTINRIQNFADFYHPQVWLSGIAVGLSSLNGCFNALVYGFTPGVRAALKSRAFCVKGGRANAGESIAGEREGVGVGEIERGTRGGENPSSVVVFYIVYMRIRLGVRKRLSGVPVCGTEHQLSDLHIILI